MPYFIDEDTHKVVSRKHAINTEVLNGKLTALDDDADCFIMAHTPNKKFGYDLRVSEETTTKEGSEKVDQLGREETAAKGQPYYDIIPVNRLNDYAANPDFTLILGDADEQTDNEAKRAIGNDQPVEIGKRVQETENTDNNVKKSRYKVTLVRDVNGESPINTSL